MCLSQGKFRQEGKQMNGRTDRRLIERTYGGTLAVVLCFGLGLACAAPSWARTPQSSAKPSAHAPASGANAPVAGAKSNGGNHEGITVHGHWLIEVRNPDGKVVSRTEFENSLQPAGKVLLAAVLSGYAPGGWMITLNGPSGEGPCTNADLTSGVGECGIVASGSYFATEQCPGRGDQCFTTLSVSNPFPATGPEANTVTLQGTATAGASGTISDVETDLNVCLSSSTPSACITGGNGQSEISFSQGVFTAASLPLSNTATTPCGGANETPCAVPVQPQQTILVSVTISFQ